MQQILIIGGSGKWCSQIYLPAILNENNQRLAAVADLISPYLSHYSKAFVDNMQKHETEWLALCGDIYQDFKLLNQYLQHQKVDTLIVTTPPLFHFAYTKWGIQKGLDIICDKPPVAQFMQFGEPTAAESLREDFQTLLYCLKDSCHRSNKSRSCRVYLPLRRRVQSPYAEIYEGLNEVFELTQQCLTYALIHLNDGSYRFADEYDLPGAHGYRDGLGSLTHTGYHLIDFAAKCLSKAPPLGQHLEANIASCKTVKHAQNITSDYGYQTIIGRSKNYNNQKLAGSNSELDLHVVYKLAENEKKPPESEIHLSIIRRGCTNRIASYYSEDCTHDEGRVDDTVIVIQQGALQSFHLLISDDAGGRVPHGYMRLVRRLNPQLAKILGKQALKVTDIKPTQGTNDNFCQNLARNLLQAFDFENDEENYYTLSLTEQFDTVNFYAQAIYASQFA